jgi:hypothetical protein
MARQDAEGGKEGSWEVGKMRRWGKRRPEDGEVFLFWIWDFELWNGEVAIE